MSTHRNPRLDSLQQAAAGQQLKAGAAAAAGHWAPVVHRHQHHVAVQQLVGPVHGVGAQHEGAAVDEDDDGERRGGAERGAEHRQVEAVLGAAGLLPAASHLHALPGTQHIAQLARVQLTATTSGQGFEFARKLIVICDNSLMTSRYPF